MFLRSLTLKGFKSFADATTLEFEPGVTVVVGPNGSGKSNVVDAVAWVLGAQGPRTVRSSRMDDVIFAGGGRRSPLGRAEVTLTIDNSSRLLPIDFSEVTITRTLFRSSGESEYAINGVPSRLLDVQELLSDTGVGRQQHVIVSQGHLASVLEAKPEDRRLIVEEAAGILKYRRRKEKAQRRLESTEGNLMRVADLLREVRRQLRPLERQAAAARRHDDLAAELTALHVYLSGRNLATLRARLGQASTTRTSARAEEATVRARLEATDSSIVSAERWVTDAGRARPDEAVARLQALQERARGLAAVLTERRRSVARELQAAIDLSMVASLEAEGERLADSLAEAETATASTRAELAALAAEEAELEGSGADDDGDVRTLVSRAVPEGQMALFAGAAEARGHLRALRVQIGRDDEQLARLEQELAVLDGRAGELSAVAVRQRTGVEEATAETERRAAALAAAGDERSRAEDSVAAAEAEMQGLTGELHRWVARADALALATAAPNAGAGRAEELGDQLVGVLGDLVAVDPGWEAAFEAAAAGALGALVVVDPAGAREALAYLARHGDAAAVVPAGGTSPEPGLPSGHPGQPVRQHVAAVDPAVETVLDRVLRRAVVVDGGWGHALDVALAHPELVVVTRQGDRFAPEGWRVGWHGPGAARAALDQARREVEAAEAAVTRSQTELAAARSVLAEASARHGESSRALADQEWVRAQAAAALAGTEATRRDVLSAVGLRRDQREETARRRADAEARVAEIEASLPALEIEEAARAEAASSARVERERREERRRGLQALRRQAEARVAELGERRSQLSRRRSEVEAALARAGAEGRAARAGRQELEVLAARTERLTEFLAGRLEAIASHLDRARRRRQHHADLMRAGSDRLERLRRERGQGERRLEETRERCRRAELEEAEARLRAEAAADAVRRDLDVEPDTAIAAACPTLPPGTSPQTRARELERELRLLGPVNPLALQELTALEERHTFLQAQLDDVKKTRRELGKVIRAVDAEMTELLSAAFADVADNFSYLFEMLFPGGKGRLRLTDAETVLEAGIEVEAQPAGKNVRRLSLLSGGERSLVALAFLFAVFRSRPSPFYLLDEVEAALDDVNLHRFLQLLDEFREQSQMVVVSHQKRTMEAADALYGVTMQAGGSSRVISERVPRARAARSEREKEARTARSERETEARTARSERETQAQPVIS